MGSYSQPVDSYTGLTEPYSYHVSSDYPFPGCHRLRCPSELPAGLTAAACPNYPYCDATGGFLPVPDVPGAAAVIAGQEAIIRSHQGIGGAVALPGIEAHAAAEAAVQQQSRAGFP